MFLLATNFLPIFRFFPIISTDFQDFRGAGWGKIRFTVNHQEEYFLWPIKFIRPGGERNDWQRTEERLIEVAQRRWIRVGAYKTVEGHDPDWPDELDEEEIVATAFRDYTIENEQHRVYREIMGEWDD